MIVKIYLLMKTLANMFGHGDVMIATREVITECCKKAGLAVERFEIRKKMRLHCVIRKTNAG